MRLNHERSLFENRRDCIRASSTEEAYARKLICHSFNFDGGLRKHRTGYCLLRTASPRGKLILFTYCDFIPPISSLIKVNFCFYVLIKDEFT